jgi:phosphatidylglycerophosphate synthase
MERKKLIPDWLTASRALIALAILGLSLVGPGALRAVAFLLLLGWTTDMVDGRLARRWEKNPTWIGEHEFHIDMLMVLASTMYLVLAGLVPPGPSLAYVGVGTVISWTVHRRSRDFLRFKAVTMILACPWVFMPFVVALWHDPATVWTGVIWAAVAMTLDWRRFLGVVGDFIEGTRAFLKRS